MQTLDEQIYDEIHDDIEKLIYKFAHDFKIHGMDFDDVCQELRIKVWKIIRDNKYDPERCKPSTFFYPVLRRKMTDLSRKKKDGMDYCDRPIDNFVLYSETLNGALYEVERTYTSKIENSGKRHNKEIRDL